MEELQKVHDKLRGRYIRDIIIVLALILTILVSVFVLKNVVFIWISAMAAVGISIGLIISASKIYTEYRRTFKNVFVLDALKDTFTDLCYDPNRGMPRQVIASTGMMYMGDRYSSEDYMSGKYKDINFEQADVHIEEEHETTDSDGHTTTTYVTIFRGRWMIFDFNKNFKANVQISQKGFGNSKVKRFFGKKEERYKKVEMESEAFNKKFKVFAQNEQEAFYIITPSLMERIERLAMSNPKAKFLFCFVNNKLHIGINNNKNSFEPPSVFKKLDIEKIKNDITSDIKLITQFVDELNLDNDLFKKEV